MKRRKHRETADAAFHAALVTCRRYFAAVAIFSLSVNLLLLAIPLYSLQIFDRVLQSRSNDTLLYLTLIAVVALVALGLIETARSQVMVALSGWLDRQLGPTVLAGAIGDIAHPDYSGSQRLRDLATFRSFLASPGIFAILDLPWMPIFVLAVYLIHPMFGSMALGGMFFLLALAIASEIVTRERLEEANEAAVKAYSLADAVGRNAETLVAMGMGRRAVARWEQWATKTIDLQGAASVKNSRIAALSRIVRLVLQIAAMGVGAWLVLKGELTAGGMIAASILMARALSPVDSAISSWRAAVSARTAHSRLRQVLRETAAPISRMPLPTPEGDLQVANLGFTYKGMKEPVLRNISFGLKPGEYCGLVGPTASGKTTLARLLVGNLKPSHGTVRLDGAEVAEWDTEDRGRHFGYLPQDVELFPATIKENIARLDGGDPDLVLAAAQAAGVHQMILSLPLGYETQVGPGGIALSGGQRQRIGLARALYGNPRFLVLDEPNASLDQVGEQALLEAVKALKSRKVTVVVIAHRPNILRVVDKILVLRNGSVARFGPRDEVLAELMASLPQGAGEEAVPTPKRVSA